VTIRLGGGQGFYGDGMSPLADLLAADLDYLVCEALAELTLAILQKDRMRDESLGYTRDLPVYLRAALPKLLEGRTKFITNAGGINPIAAGRAAMDTLKAAGATGLTVATIVGDDVRAHADSLGLPADVLFANAYLGARPIVTALAQGADVIITGRVADASLFAAPLIHEFEWAWDDWDRLAAGVTVGHLLECSGQVTGGNYSGAWWDNPDPDRIAFPIADCEADGTAVITKPPETGGMVTFDTVREQLLYEVHDPARYLNPDVTADFTAPTLADLGDDSLRITGCHGTPAPPSYKGLVCTPAGWAGELRVVYTWPDAEAKARAALGFARRRAERAGIQVEEWVEEYFGAGGFGGPTVPPVSEPPEVIGRLAWRCADPATAGAVTRATQLGVLGLSGPPGISGIGRAGGGGKPTQLLAVDAIGLDRGLVDGQVRIDLETV
jgi:hypothetical protein